MDNDLKAGVALLKQGRAPGNAELLKKITVAVDSLAYFLLDKYLIDFIASGGCKIKFVTGKAGSGKTHFMQFLSSSAKEHGFATVNFSAKDIWLHDFKDTYAEIFKKTDFFGALTKCAETIINELGYDYSAIPDGMTFIDYLSSSGESDPLIKMEIRNQLRTMFLNNPLIDSNFATACSLLTGGILGHPALVGSSRDLLMGWLVGDSSVTLSALRNIGMSPSRINKFNARHMLRSLAEVYRIASVPGILITVDDLDVFVNASSLETVRYTKLRREDAYESIRELIDGIDALRYIMFIFAFDRELMDNELTGIKSYQALWLRIQNEIISGRFNKFSDIIDLDRYGAEIFTKESLIDMSGRIADAVNAVHYGAGQISGDGAEAIIARVKYMSTSTPRLVALSTVNGGGEPEGLGDE